MSKYILLSPIQFPNLGYCYFSPVEYRSPMVGEFYMSTGVNPVAIEANGGEPDAWIIVPTYKATKRTTWARGSKIYINPNM